MQDSHKFLEATRAYLKLKRKFTTAKKANLVRHFDEP